ncbi:MAG TPA: hypothetical protein VGP07_14275 [Polyangia bacterium]|jgi:hypothetical protein
MLNSTVLDVALGLVFCWGAVALIASSIYESIASLLKLRARDLLNGVKELLNDQAFTGLALGVYRSALVNPRAPGTSTTETTLTVKPSYIDPMHFAAALLEAIQGAPDAVADLDKKIAAIKDDQIRTMVLGMYARAGGQIEETQKQLAGWFSAGMERVSGVYKRRAQVFSFLIALAVAAALNIDTFHLFRALWIHPADIAGLPVPVAASTALAELKELPVGRPGLPLTLVSVLGWLATACSAPFGAPFWFGLLQRLVNLRGTGPKPAA